MKIKTITVVTASAVAVGVAVSSGSFSNPAEQASAASVAVGSSLKQYNPTAMPTKLEARARQYLSSGDGGLGTGRFMAGNAKFQALSSNQFQKAKFMYVIFGEGTGRSRKLFSGHVAEEEKPNEESWCGGLASGVMVECSVVERADGALVASSIVSSAEAPAEVYGPGRYMFSPWSEVTPATLPSMQLTRSVSVIWPGNFETSVIEEVRNPQSLVAAENFVEDAEVMTALASDPDLVIPKVE